MSDYSDEGTSWHVDIDAVNEFKKNSISLFVFIVDLVYFVFFFYLYNSYFLRHGGPSADQLNVPFSITRPSPSKRERKVE